MLSLLKQHRHLLRATPLFHHPSAFYSNIASDGEKKRTATLMQAHAAPNIIVLPNSSPSSSTKWMETVQHRLPPVRKEFIQAEPLTSSQLAAIAIEADFCRHPQTIHDRVALRTVKILRWFADRFFRHRYIHRAIVLETVAAVPGMVAGMLRHMRSLRMMRHDGGWIHRLLHEAENERMHLMTWMKLTQPSIPERLLITLAQGVFFTAFAGFYVASPKTAHRMVGYLEEEAIVSYTRFLQEIDSGAIANVPAPPIAIEYWNLVPEATLRDVVLAVRADEAAHRDVNHHLADRLVAKKETLREPLFT